MYFSRIKEYFSAVIFTVLFGLFIIISLRSIFQIQGHARVVNYAGIVRGATQRLIKEEMYGLEDDPLIAKLTSIIDNLATGEGEHNLVLLKDDVYIDRLSQVKDKWNVLQGLIAEVRKGGDKQELFDVSEEYFELVNEAVFDAEKFSESRVESIISTLINIDALFAFCFVIWGVFAIRNAIGKMRAAYDFN